MTEPTRFNHAGPHFVVSDVPVAVDFYSVALGFGVDYLDGEPPHYAVVFRDNVYIHLSLRAPLSSPIGPGCAFLAVSGIDPLWARVAAARVEVIEPLADRDYGHGARFRVFTIRDPYQNVLRIGESLA
jgi:predicted enzyme related to lactoylglutathione lyase